MLFAFGCSVEPSRPKNLIIVSIDTLVAARMHTYGGPRPNTPNIDRLAQRSTLFKNAFSTAPWTLPAHASMLSGLYPLSISTHAKERRYYELAPMLAERFRQAGVATGAVTGGGYCSANFGFDKGFDFFAEFKKEDGLGPEVASSARFLGKNRDQPFFFFFHTFVAHEPMLDRRYVKPGAGGRLKQIYQPHDGRKLLYQVCCEDMDVRPGEKKFMLQLYDGGVAAADEIVGQLIWHLERLSLMDKTDIIITSDHGQEFWEHTRRGGHGHSLYQELLRIPLIWYRPEAKASGSVQTADVSLVDLVPTIVRRFGLETEDEFDGVDLAPLFSGVELPEERFLFAEAIHHGPERFSIWNRKAKLTVTPNPEVQLDIGKKNPVSVAAREELFARADYFETHNVAESKENASLLEEMSHALSTRRLSAAKTTLAKDDDAPSPQLDEAAIEELRALGYLE